MEDSLKRTTPCYGVCHLAYAMRILGGRWKVPILCALHFGGTLRYNELLREIEGITNTMLASSLRDLVRDGLVRREQFNEVPARVEYSLTPACDKLVPALRILREWGEDMAQLECDTAEGFAFQGDGEARLSR